MADIGSEFFGLARNMPGAWDVGEKAVWGAKEHELTAVDFDGDCKPDQLFYSGIDEPYVGPRAKEFIGRDMCSSTAKWMPLHDDAVAYLKNKLSEARSGSIRQGQLQEDGPLENFLFGGAEVIPFVGALALFPPAIPAATAVTLPGFIDAVRSARTLNDYMRIAGGAGVGAGFGSVALKGAGMSPMAGEFAARRTAGVREPAIAAARRVETCENVGRSGLLGMVASSEAGSGWGVAGFKNWFVRMFKVGDKETQGRAWLDHGDILDRIVMNTGSEWTSRTYSKYARYAYRRAAALLTSAVESLNIYDEHIPELARLAARAYRGLFSYEQGSGHYSAAGRYALEAGREYLRARDYGSAAEMFALARQDFGLELPAYKVHPTLGPIAIGYFKIADELLGFAKRAEALQKEAGAKQVDLAHESAGIPAGEPPAHAADQAAAPGSFDPKAGE